MQAAAHLPPPIRQPRPLSGPRKRQLTAFGLAPFRRAPKSMLELPISYPVCLWLSRLLHHLLVVLGYVANADDVNDNGASQQQEN
ncbi:hypothetical protein CPLU01_08421 [Colletotrichum plurivorum]|uniref:Uncharacterized protein n=1 Tax=Colletotrichum plurivorum TaxID=2175906 RepID=A0A8H6KBD1_9PEZI|nr:hypothetical protein CPLU01_08421 [Colletotrichum plurivorum]